MAVSLHPIADGRVDSVQAALHTVAANKLVVVSSIIATNTDLSNSINVTFYLKSVGGTARAITPISRKIEPGYTLVFDNINAALKENYTIEAVASVANKIDYWISGIIQDV